MKANDPNSALDNHIKNALKSSGSGIQMVDWSEIEVLIRHEKSPIPIEINKRTALIAAAAAMGLILLFGIFKLVQYYSSQQKEEAEPPVPEQTSFNAIDTQKTSVAYDSSTVKADTIKVESSPIVEKKDSAAIIRKDTSSTKVKTPPKQNKKQNTTTSADTSSVKNIIAEPVVKDTVQPPPVQEIKIPTPVSIDSSGKKKSALNIFSKKKKQKAIKTDTPPAEIKSDSLK